MSSQNNKNNYSLTKELLKKCEVSNLNQFYHKWLNENDHIIAVRKICAIHKNFHEEKVLKDLTSINDIVLINIIDYTRRKHLRDLERQKYLVDFKGIGKILNYLKRRGYIRWNMPLKDVFQKLGIESQAEAKVISLINIAINKRILFATIDKSNNKQKELMLIFYSRLKHPHYRKEFIKFIITAILGGVLITILLPIILFINAQG
ncbi:MAG: hypothetical protein ACTSR8_17545 [Promethearchaeota archaeon]